MPFDELKPERQHNVAKLPLGGSHVKSDTMNLAIHNKINYRALDFSSIKS